MGCRAMTFDPYNNRIPTYLLTAEELQALKDTGGPWECTIHGVNWNEVDDPNWWPDHVYRAKAKPPEPVVRWINEYEYPYVFDGRLYNSREQAESIGAKCFAYIRTRRVVIE